MSMESLKKAMRKANQNRDNFDVGTVIRWKSGGQYDYAALKTGVGWFTIAREYNTFVDQQVTFAQLLKILSRSETTDVCVATEWLNLSEQATDIADEEDGPGILDGFVEALDAGGHAYPPVAGVTPGSLGHIEEAEPQDVDFVYSGSPEVLFVASDGGIRYTQFTAPAGTIALIGPPANQKRIVRAENGTWYTESGTAISNEDFRSGWSVISFPPGY